MKFRLRSQYGIMILFMILSFVIVLTMVLSSRTQSAMKELSYTTSVQMEQALVDQLKRRARILVGFVANELEQPLANGSTSEEIYEKLRSAIEQPDVEYIYVHDSEGRIVHDGSPENLLKGQVLDNELIRKALSARKMHFDIVGDALEVGKPIRQGNRLVGAVRVGYSIESIILDIDRLRTNFYGVKERISRQASREIIILTILFIFLGVVIASVLSKHLTQPIGTLAAITERIRKGDYDVDIPINSSDEIGDLAHSFRIMAQDLRETSNQEKKRTDELQSAKNKLELTVQELDQAYSKLSQEYEERKRLESVAFQSEKMAAMGRMAAGVAHEINNPLAVILGYAQLLLVRLKSGDVMGQQMKAIESEARRCQSLVKDLLIFSRLESGPKEQIDLNQIISSSLKLIEAQAKVTHVEIASDLAKQPLEIYAHVTQIQQIIINLGGNAIDAMPEGGRLGIRTRKIQRGGKAYVLIEIEDTGSGIPADVQPKVFEPFFTTKEVGKGTGLGLSLVYEMVQKYEGTIEFESQEGKGTTFSIAFPLLRSSKSVDNKDAEYPDDVVQRGKSIQGKG